MHSILLRDKIWDRANNKSVLFDPHKKNRNRSCLGILGQYYDIDDVLMAHYTSFSSSKILYKRLRLTDLCFLISSIDVMDSRASWQLLLLNDDPHIRNDFERTKLLNRIVNPYNFNFMFRK